MPAGPIELIKACLDTHPKYLSQSGRSDLIDNIDSLIEAFQDVVTQHKAAIERHESDIARCQATIRSLETKRNTCSPPNRLPPEILEYIFRNFIDKKNGSSPAFLSATYAAFGVKLRYLRLHYGRPFPCQKI